MYYRSQGDTQPLSALDLEEGELEDGELDDDEPVAPVLATDVPAQLMQTDNTYGKTFIPYLIL